jgi:hypothetical protein
MRQGVMVKRDWKDSRNVFVGGLTRYWKDPQNRSHNGSRIFAVCLKLFWHITKPMVGLDGGIRK